MFILQKTKSRAYKKRGESPSIFLPRNKSEKPIESPGTHHAPGWGAWLGFSPTLPVRFAPLSGLRFRITAPKRGVSAPPPSRLGFSLPLPVGFSPHSRPPPGRMVGSGGRAVSSRAYACRANSVPLDTIRNNSSVLTKSGGGKKVL